MQNAAIKREYSQFDADQDSLITSIQNAQGFDDPYQHWILSDIFTSETLEELNNLAYEAQKLDYAVGTREENNKYRQYFDLPHQARMPVVKRVADILQSQEVLNAFHSLCGANFPGHFLRIEFCQDQEGFWLHPHTDIGVKMFTMLFYLNDEPQANMWGTDIYKDAETHAKRTQFKANSALLFVPSKNTWHGFEPREMTGIRKSLIINYVTDEWRNRHELASEAPLK